jgi:aldose sugar dehydrogenase
LNGVQVLKHEFLLKNQYGRIREVVAGPDGYIYFSTSQHDPPEGQPKPGYDKIFRLIPANDPAGGNSAVAGNTVLEKSKDPVSAKESVRNEQQIFQQLCANCHGDNLQGTAAAGSLVDGIWKFGGAEKAIFFSIKKGHPEAGMPAWEGALTDKQIKRLVDFIVRQAQ